MGFSIGVLDAVSIPLCDIGIGSDIAGLLISAIQVPLSDIVGIAEASYFNPISKTTECIVDAVIS